MKKLIRRRSNAFRMFDLTYQYSGSPDVIFTGSYSFFKPSQCRGSAKEVSPSFKLYFKLYLFKALTRDLITNSIKNQVKTRIKMGIKYPAWWEQVDWTRDQREERYISNYLVSGLLLTSSEDGEVRVQYFAPSYLHGREGGETSCKKFRPGNRRKLKVPSSAIIIIVKARSRSLVKTLCIRGKI